MAGDFFYTFDKTVLKEKEIKMSRKIIFCYLASFYVFCILYSEFYISKKHMLVIQMVSIQGGSKNIAIIKLGKNCKRPKDGNIFFLFLID